MTDFRKELAAQIDERIASVKKAFQAELAELSSLKASLGKTAAPSAKTAATPTAKAAAKPKRRRSKNPSVSASNRARAEKAQQEKTDRVRRHLTAHATEYSRTPFTATSLAVDVGNGVSRASAKKALQQLAKEGVVFHSGSSQGGGSSFKLNAKAPVAPASLAEYKSF